MLEIKWLGALMVVPTVSLCIWIIYKTKGLTEVYINWAILFWICANSFWMLSEFFNHSNYKLYATFPFVLGFIFVVVFYIKSGLRSNTTKESL